MRIKQLILRNFGLYRGEQTLDLSPRPKNGKARPIVLIGGHNGAGKTTILEAIRLCLYGRLALGSRVSETEYQAFLRGRIHRSRAVVIPLAYASVALEFEYARAGKRCTYLIKRAWETRGENGVTESLRLLRDGQPLTEVESEFWPEFVRSLVPPGVSQLFFFDGERIKRFADEDTEAATLAESIKALLGLDLVERLQADLDLYKSRSLKRTAKGVHGVRLADIETSESGLRQRLEEIGSGEALLKARLVEVSEAIDRAEQQLAQGGEGLSAQRGALRQRKGDLEARQENLERALRDHCDGPLPFVLCPTLSAELIGQLEAEAERERSDATRDDLKRALEALNRRLTVGDLPRRLGWDENSCVAVGQEVAAFTEELLRPSDSTTDRVHSLSDRSREQTVRTIREALQALPPRVSELTKELNLTSASLHDVQRHLMHAPDGDEMAPLVKDLSVLQHEHALCTLELTLKSELRDSVDRELRVLVRERERILKAEEESQVVTGRLALASVARQALDAYLARLTSAKVEELEAVALHCFQALSRKRDRVHRLAIDPQTFVVSLFDEGSDPIPKSSLSAGEKQIYAVSLLWSLAKVSGRALPMIIDTPLGRLDSVHRQHLLEKYFPVASHQVIILSTDTEVDQAYFEQLRPHTSHCLHLADQKGGWTEAAPGYFSMEASANVGTPA